jgi:uncharacterized membrane protein YgcG
VRVAAAAFVAAAIFLGGVMVGLGSGDEGDREAPVAIALVDEGTAATPNATPRAQDDSNVEKVEHPAKQGEVDDNSGPGGDKVEYWEEEDEDNSGPGGDDDDTDDSSGPGSGDDSSGPGSGGDDNSGSGSSSSGSGSDGSGDSSGPG